DQIKTCEFRPTFLICRSNGISGDVQLEVEYVILSVHETADGSAVRLLSFVFGVNFVILGRRKSKDLILTGDIRSFGADHLRFSVLDEYFGAHDGFALGILDQSMNVFGHRTGIRTPFTGIGEKLSRRGQARRKYQ